MKLKLNEVLIEPCESIILKNREFGSDTSKMAVEEVQGPLLYPLPSNNNLPAIHRLKCLCERHRVQIGGFKTQMGLKTKDGCFEKAGSHPGGRLSGHSPGYRSINTSVPVGFSYRPV